MSAVFVQNRKNKEVSINSRICCSNIYLYINVVQLVHVLFLIVILHLLYKFIKIFVFHLLGIFPPLNKCERTIRNWCLFSSQFFFIFSLQFGKWIWSATHSWKAKRAVISIRYVDPMEPLCGNNLKIVQCVPIICIYYISIVCYVYYVSVRTKSIQLVQSNLFHWTTTRISNAVYCLFYSYTLFLWWWPLVRDLFIIVKHCGVMNMFLIGCEIENENRVVKSYQIACVLYMCE